MKTEKIKVITIEDFKDYTELIIYMDENIGILSGFNVIIKKSHDIAKLGCMLIAFCEEGEIMYSINGHQHLLQKDHCAILPPGTIIRRSDVNKYIKDKLVLLNYVEVLNPNKIVNIGDIISIRKVGKFIISKELAKSRKDNIFLEVKKYN